MGRDSTKYPKEPGYEPVANDTRVRGNDYNEPEEDKPTLDTRVRVLGLEEKSL